MMLLITLILANAMFNAHMAAARQERALRWGALTYWLLVAGYWIAKGAA